MHACAQLIRGMRIQRNQAILNPTDLDVVFGQLYNLFDTVEAQRGSPADRPHLCTATNTGMFHQRYEIMVQLKQVYIY